MRNERRDKEAEKPESQSLQANIERDYSSMAPKITELIEEDQEDSTTTDQESSSTSSLHISTGDEPIIKNVSEDDQEISDGIVLDIQEVILDEIKIQENININDNEWIPDHTDLQLNNNSGYLETGNVSTLEKREALIYKKLKKADLTRTANGLRLPRNEVREKLLPQIGEQRELTLIDHQGQEWDMLLAHNTNQDIYFLKGRHWHDYAELYRLAVSDTIVIETITKVQVKEELDFGAVSEIGDHDWDAIFPPNSTWKIEKKVDEEDDNVEQLTDELGKCEIKDIGKVEQVVSMYGITIKRGP